MHRKSALPRFKHSPPGIRRRSPTDRPSIGPLEGHDGDGLQLSAEQSSATIDELLDAQEHERRRLGQELHDSTGQLVVSLMLSLARLRRVEDSIGQRGLIDELEGVVRQIDKEIRSLAFLHHPAELGDFCLATSLESFTRGFSQRTGMHVGFDCVGDTPPMSESLSTALLRVTQEALVNVQRHAQATFAKVELKSLPGRIELRIFDDGIGLPGAEQMKASGGIGLLGMRHRIEAQGGRFEIRNQPRGTVACAIVPIAPILNQTAKAG